MNAGSQIDVESRGLDSGSETGSEARSRVRAATTTTVLRSSAHHLRHHLHHHLHHAHHLALGALRATRSSTVSWSIATAGGDSLTEIEVYTSTVKHRVSLAF